MQFCSNLNLSLYFLDQSPKMFTRHFKSIDMIVSPAVTEVATHTFGSNKSASRRSSKLLAWNFSCLLELVTATTRSNYTKQHTVH